MSQKKLKNELIGTTGKNSFGSVMEIVEYNRNDDIWVKFDENNLVHTTLRYFREGKVKNVNDKSVFGVGFVGKGLYKPSVNCELTLQYKKWKDMLRRCYDTKYLQRNPTYNNCYVAEEWHNFQTFAKWYDDNYFTIDGEEIHLDKDILVKGNKVYSPDTCMFVPSSFNVLFTKRDNDRGKFPIGINNSKGGFHVRCCDGNGKQIYFGCYGSIEESFQVYKTEKEKLIKQIAEVYKGKIPEKLYLAMMKYEVEITD